MGTTLVEIVLLLAAVYGLYRLLRPLQRRLEYWILGLLAPGRPRIIDLEATDVKKWKPYKE